MHRKVFEELEKSIREGKYRSGEKLPSEAALVRQFGTSRITVGRAVRDLQLVGLVERRAGSGTYVRPAGKVAGGMVFGLLIPDLGRTDVFEAICQGMASAPEAAQHSLLWGNVPDAISDREEQAWQLCQQFIAKRVDGIFFAPLELTSGMDSMNSRILNSLESARIPVVLLDRDALPYPRRTRHDLVGIDNRRAGYLITEHLLSTGSRRIAFMGLPQSAPTVDARVAGYSEALFTRGLMPMVQRIDPANAAAVRGALERLRPEAIICANDRTAGRLMHTLLAMGTRIPANIRIAGIDDVEYASLMQVPLTTIHQPSRGIGEAAMAAMLDRIKRPSLPAREILLDCRLVVRQSTAMARSE